MARRNSALDLAAAAFVLLLLVAPSPGAADEVSGGDRSIVHQHNLLSEHTCKDLSVISQRVPGKVLKGVPVYQVQIKSSCKCTIANLHLKCGHFSPAVPVNPETFRRVTVDDCLVNAGRAMQYGETLLFEYANLHEYKLTLKTVNFIC